jgi:glycosyltransferase involved in cell wall biosynthesis
MKRPARYLLPMLRKALGRWPGGVFQKTIAVDLTPYPPPAANGVDVALVSSWLRDLAELQPHWRWILLTSPGNHPLFAALESARMQRRVTPPQPEVRMPAAVHALYSSRWRRAWKVLLHKVGLPRPPVLLPSTTLLRQLGADLLLCPCGTSHYHDGAVPTVVFWNDLTHLHYPQFMRDACRDQSGRAFRQALHVADRLVCFSDQARTEILHTGMIEGRRVVALRLRSAPHRRLPAHDVVRETLQQHGLSDGNYLIFPGDFTEVNNHKVLLVAWGMVRARHPHEALQMVCAGAAPALAEDLGQAASCMGLGRSVVFVPTPSAPEMTALLRGCRAVLFPALAGTQALMLLHALECGKPLFCSDQAHLPEVVQSAAFLFNPKKPAELVQVLERCAEDQALLATLARQSRAQARALASPRDTVQQLVDVFQEAMATSRRFTDAVKGIYPDGWTSERIVVTWSATAAHRAIRLTLRGADWLPWPHQRVRLFKDLERTGTTFKLRRGQVLTIEHDLPAAGGHLEFLFDPPAVPSVLGLGDDDRLLGCYCKECLITSPGAEVRLHGCAPTAA